jgi:HK97 family phage portal protein
MGFGNWLSNLFSGRKKNAVDNQGFDSKVITLDNLLQSSEVRSDLNATFVSASDTNADFCCKIRPWLNFKGSESPNKKYINRLLQLQPNEVMNATRFWKAVAKSYFENNIAVIWLCWDYSARPVTLSALYPLDIFDNNVDLAVNQDNGKLYGIFYLGGTKHEVDAEDLVIVQREASVSDLLQGRSKSIDGALKVIQAEYDTAEKAIIQARYLKFLVNYGTVYSDEMLKKEQAQLENVFNSSKSGLFIVPSNATMTPVQGNSDKWLPQDDLEGYKDDIYRYLGTNKKIVERTFTEDEYQSFYEGTLEPFCKQLSDELNIKLLTKTEYDLGNRVDVSSDPLQTASLRTRISIAQTMLSMPTIIPNDVLRLLHQPTYDGGDTPQSSLNYVNAQKKDQYQGVGSDTSTTTNNGGTSNGTSK